MGFALSKEWEFAGEGGGLVGGGGRREVDSSNIGFKFIISLS